MGLRVGDKGVLKYECNHCKAQHPTTGDGLATWWIVITSIKSKVIIERLKSVADGNLLANAQHACSVECALRLAEDAAREIVADVVAKKLTGKTGQEQAKEQVKDDAIAQIETLRKFVEESNKTRPKTYADILGDVAEKVKL